MCVCNINHFTDIINALKYKLKNNITLQISLMQIHKNDLISTNNAVDLKRSIFSYRFFIVRVKMKSQSLFFLTFHAKGYFNSFPLISQYSLSN